MDFYSYSGQVLVTYQPGHHEIEIAMEIGHLIGLRHLGSQIRNVFLGGVLQDDEFYPDLMGIIS